MPQGWQAALLWFPALALPPVTEPDAPKFPVCADMSDVGSVGKKVALLTPNHTDSSRRRLEVFLVKRQKIFKTDKVKGLLDETQNSFHFL